MDPIRSNSNQRTARRHRASWRPLSMAVALALATVSGACAADDEAAPSMPEVSEYPGEPSSDGTDAVESAATTIGATATALAVSMGQSNDATDLAAELAELAGADSVTAVEYWAPFADVDEVEAAITRNLGVGDNAMTLTLGKADVSAPLQGPGLLLTYDIPEAPPHDFVGFNRDLDGLADWSGASAVALWVGHARPASVNLVFQFRERSGEVWRHEGPMPALDSGAPLMLPLDTATFEWANWSTEENGTMDLGAIDQYGLYLGHTGPGRAGIVHLGPIALVR